MIEEECEDYEKKLEAKKKRNDYLKMDRVAGTGPLRIGTQLKLAEDLYSLCFAASFRTEYVFHSAETKGENDDD